MNVLTNLLPGTRELRAPLAAGCLWLLCAWLAFGHEIPDGSPADESIWQAIVIARNELGPIARGVATAFAAYLIGALSEAARRIISQQAQAMRERINLKIGPLEIASGPSVRWRVATIERVRSVGRPLRLGQTGRRSIEQVVRNEIERLNDAMEQDGRAADGLAFVHADFDDLRRSYGELPAGHDTDFLREVILREGEATRTRLLVSNIALFSRIDRLRSEADLRFAVALPLAALAITILARSPHDVAATSVAAGFLAGACALHLDGRHKQRKGDDALVEALAIGAVSTPTMSRLQALTDDPSERERFTRWRTREATPDDAVRRKRVDLA